MSIKNYRKVIYVIDSNTGQILDVIHDYFKYSKEIEKAMLFETLGEKLEENQELVIKYGKEV